VRCDRGCHRRIHQTGYPPGLLQVVLGAPHGWSPRLLALIEASFLNPSLRPFAAARRCGGLAKFLSRKAGNSDSTPWVPVHRHQRSVSTPAAGKLSVARRTERNTSERSSVTRPMCVFFGVLIHFFTSKFNVRFTLTPPLTISLPHSLIFSPVPIASRRPPFSLAIHSRGALACFNTTPAVPQRTFFSHLPALSPDTTHAPPRSSVSSTHTCLRTGYT